jgi:hypothetical protein
MGAGLGDGEEDEAVLVRNDHDWAGGKTRPS